nr:hypothetical protein [Tanacetum cinerariifolium]
GQLINSAVGTFLHWQWQNSSSSGNYFALPVGTSSGSGNFLLAVGTSSGSDDEEDVESEVEGIARTFAWNVRGLNNTPNQDQVIQLLREDNFSLCGLLETHVKKKNLSRICGMRIIVGWDPSSVHVKVLEQSSQVLHCFMEPVNDLHKHKISVKDRPWVILCDFNACLNPSERSSGCSKSNKVKGIAMFSLVSKLKLLKKPLRKLNFDQGNLFENVKRLRADLVLAQLAVCSGPHNGLLREMEAKAFKAYKFALRDEEFFLKQKVKIQWLDEGDKNSKYFHNVIKGRLNRNRISYIEDLNGNAFHGNNVGEQFVKHFKNVLEVLLTMKLGKALFEIDGNKAPGPDGFFFKNGKILKEINATVISLVPKIDTPSKVSDFRPIACCNVIYKIISKIISNRLKGILGFLVDVNQCAFIPFIQISDNILISQELMRGYHIDRGFAKCAFKVDIQKAYDSVEWEFLACCLKAFGFRDTLIR